MDHYDLLNWIRFQIIMDMDLYHRRNLTSIRAGSGSLYKRSWIWSWIQIWVHTIIRTVLNFKKIALCANISSLLKFTLLFTLSGEGNLKNVRSSCEYQVTYNMLAYPWWKFSLRPCSYNFSNPIQCKNSRNEFSIRPCSYNFSNLIQCKDSRNEFSIRPCSYNFSNPIQCKDSRN